MATNVLSPRGSGDSTALSSPQSRRPRGVTSPWTQIVRGADSEPVVVSVGGGAVAAPSSPSAALAEQISSSFSDWPASKPPPPPDTSASPSIEDDFAGEAQPENYDSGNSATKQVWGKPSNGNGNGAAVEVSPVMDTASWPALSACTKASPKSSSSDSLKALSEGSLTPSQGSGVASFSSNKPVIANNANPSSPNHVTNTRQRTMKRGSANGGFIQLSPQPQPQPQGPAVETPLGKPGTIGGESSSHKDGGQKGGFGNDHQPHRSNSFNRRGSGGQHPRGDGSYHHNYGRRDQDRGNQEWNNAHRSFGGRDNHMQQQRPVQRGYPRVPPPAFMPPPAVPVRPFVSQLVYPESPSLIYVPGSPEPLRAVPIMAQMSGAHPLYFFQDPQLQAKIVTQIDYYFSNDNLIKDTYLRQNMDDQGWVPIKLIASFKKVMNLTDNIHLILNAVQASTVVEVQNDKIRRRNDWMKWIMPPVVSSPQSHARYSHDMLTGQFQGITLDEKTMHGQNEMFNRSSSGEFNSQLQQSGAEGTARVVECVAPAGSPSK